MYYGTNEGKIILEEFHILWKHHNKHLKEMHQGNEHMYQQISKNNPKFESGQQVMVKKHACCTFKLQYLLDYKELKILNDSTLLLVTTNGKEKKTDINNFKPCSTSDLI